MFPELEDRLDFQRLRDRDGELQFGVHRIGKQARVLEVKERVDRSTRAFPALKPRQHVVVGRVRDRPEGHVRADRQNRVRLVGRSVDFDKKRPADYLDPLRRLVRVRWKRNHKVSRVSRQRRDNVIPGVRETQVVNHGLVVLAPQFNCIDGFNIL